MEYAVGRLHGLLIDVTIVQQLQEEVVDHLPVIVRPGAGEQVEADAELAPGFEKLRMVVAGDLRRGTSLQLCSKRDRGPMLISARHHEDIVSEQPVKAGKDITRQVSAGDLADVQRAVGVRPRHAHKDLFRQSNAPVMELSS